MAVNTTSASMRNASPVPDELAVLQLGALEQHAADRAAVALEPQRPRPGADRDAAGLREFALVFARLHVVDAAPIGDGDALGAEPLRLHGGVDRGHAAADHDDAPADRQFRQIGRLPEVGDIFDGVDDVGERALAVEPELVGSGRPAPMNTAA